ncbi:MAG: ELWxxDGT repeat protein [Ginsengibacter sp.]
MKKIAILLFSAFLLNTAYSQTAELYKDINNLLNNPSITSEPEFTTVGNKVFFIAEEPLTGKELYVSDGTREGTRLIDINPGTGSSSPSNLTEMGGFLYFSAYDRLQSKGTELWRSDGTPEGTTVVKDIYVSQGMSSYPTQLTNVNGTLYFVADDGIHGKELWKSNGTEVGTELVKDIVANYGSSNPFRLTAVESTLYFSATNGTDGIELWKSNGTEATTIMVKNINTNAGASSNPNYLTNYNGMLYFAATDADGHYELWKSDGTPGNTKMVEDIIPGSFASGAAYLTVFNGSLYFSATDIAHGREVWKTEGTTGTTVMLKDINPGSASSFHSNFIAVGNTMYFIAFTPDEGTELWKTDGTPTGTKLVKDINSGTGSSNPTNLINFNSKLYFTTSSPVAFYTTDGTPGGTVPINDAVLGGGNIKSFHAGPTKIYFTSRVYKEGYPETATGTEPWVSNGTDAGTTLLKDINTRNYPSNPKNFFTIGTTTYFAADDGIHGNELWKTDGTAAGTSLVKDIRTGNLNADPQGFANLNGTLYFAAYSNETGFELWKSDGSTNGTTQVKDIFTGTATNGYPNSSNPYMIAAINGLLYFSANDGTAGGELWSSDGTPGGTILLADINSGPGHSYPANFTEVNGTIFFTASNGTTGANSDLELWKIDGVTGNVTRVKDIYPGTRTSNVSGLTNFKNKLYFTASDGVNPVELWMSDGTEAGTISFREFSGGSAIRFPKDFKVIGNTMYFIADNPVGGGEAIWKTDGTFAGTILIKDIGSSYTPAQITSSNGLIYFVGDIFGYGTELWKTDGTADGTKMVKDINPGSLKADPLYLTDFKGTLYFRATGAGFIYDLWKSNGTADGTVSLNLNSQGTSSSPSGLTVMNDYLIFSAEDFYKGYELWRLINYAAPVTLMKFTASKVNKSVALNWQTTNEVNTSVFEIERAGKSDFVKIGDVAAMNKSGVHNYKMTDAQPLNGSNFYRLKMVDIDGKSTYSNIERVDFNVVEQVLISPNPAANELKINNVNGYDLVQVLDASGRIVHQQKISGDRFVGNIQKLTPGTYMVRLTGKNSQKSLQFVKQ